MDGEEAFEPDYFEDLSHSADIEIMDSDDLEVWIEEELECYPPLPERSDNVKAKENSDAGLTVPSISNSIINVDDEELEGDGVFLEDDNVQMDCVRPFSGFVKVKTDITENDSWKSCEEMIKSAVTSKKWNVLSDIFGKCNPNIREQLCYFCADMLKSPTEFLGIIKSLQDGERHQDVAMIGSKLLVNSDLCSNFKAGTFILRMLVDASIWFHNLKIKVLPIEDVVKAAVQCCLQDKNYLLLSKLMTKSNLFSIISHKSSIEDSDSKDYIPTQMLNLSVFFQHTMNALSSDERYFTKPVLQIASICLNILKILLEANANSFGTKPKQMFKAILDLPKKVWLLCKMFISGKMFKEIVILMTLSASHPDLITWSSFNYKSVLLFFSEHYKQISKVYKGATTYLKILHGEGSASLPVYKEYEEREKVLNLFSSMDKSEMTVYLALFASSAVKHMKQEQVCWTIRLINKEITFVGFNEAKDRLENVIRQFHYLKSVYAGKSVFLVTQRYCPRWLKRVHPLDIPFTPQFSKVENNFLTSCETALATSASPLETGDSKRWAPNLNFKTKNDIPQAILNHPRFAMSSKNEEDGLPTQKALFSRTLNNHIRSRFSEVVPLFTKTEINSWADSAVYQRLKYDINARLTFYINAGQLSPVAARHILLLLPDKLFNYLPRDSNERAMYDDDAFVKIQSLVDANVKSLLNSKLI